MGNPRLAPADVYRLPTAATIRVETTAVESTTVCPWQQWQCKCCERGCRDGGGDDECDDGGIGDGGAIDNDWRLGTSTTRGQPRASQGSPPNGRMLRARQVLVVACATKMAVATTSAPTVVSMQVGVAAGSGEPDGGNNVG